MLHKCDFGPRTSQRLDNGQKCTRSLSFSFFFNVKMYRIFSCMAVLFLTCPSYICPSDIIVFFLYDFVQIFAYSGKNEDQLKINIV